MRSCSAAALTETLPGSPVQTEQACGQQCADPGLQSIIRGDAINMSALPSPTSSSAFTDFVFDPSEKLDSLGGPKQRYLSNVAAIKLLKQLEAECRPPGSLTTDEQQTLARYCGWGDTEVFNHSCIRKSHCLPPGAGRNAWY
jgi:hypothetical protein